MKQLLDTLKKNRFLKVYLGAFIAINFAYLYFEIKKSIYIGKYTLNGPIEKTHFKYLSRYSQINGWIELIIILLVLITLVRVMRAKQTKAHSKTLLTGYLIVIVFLFLMNILIAVIFRAPIGNVTQQLANPFAVTIVIMIYDMLKKSAQRRLL